MTSQTLTAAGEINPAKPARKSSVALQLRLVRTGFRVLGSLAPKAAGGWAYRLWFTPRRRQRSQAEEEFLRTADSYQRLPFRGGEVAVAAWGRGPAVLLVHGWEGRGTQLAGFVGPLLARGFRVVALDLPAHGDSSGRMTNLVEIERVMAHLAEREGGFHALIAHSFGGVVSAFAMRRGFAVDRAVFIAAPCRLQTMLGIFQKMLSIPERAMVNMVARMRRQFAHLGPDFFQAVDTDSNLKDLQVKGLVIHDRDDKTVPFGQSELARRAWPESRFFETKGLGHSRILKSAYVIDETVSFISA